MWKWIVGIVFVVGLLGCLGVVGGGGWWLWQKHRGEQAAEHAAQATEEARVQAEAAAQAVVAERASRFGEGKARYAAGDWNGAVDALTDVLEAEPDNAEALLDRGQSYAHLERPALAEPDLRAVTKLTPSDKQAWATLGWVLAHEGQDTEAVDAYTHLLALDPSDAKALRDRANSRYHTGDARGARDDAAQACTLGLAEGCALQDKMQAASRR